MLKTSVTTLILIWNHIQVESKFLQGPPDISGREWLDQHVAGAASLPTEAASQDAPINPLSAEPHIMTEPPMQRARPQTSQLSVRGNMTAESNLMHHSAAGAQGDAFLVPPYASVYRRLHLLAARQAALWFIVGICAAVRRWPLACFDYCYIFI